MSGAVLGISAWYHDSAAALVQDGRVVAAASEERFSRLKHDAGLPLRAARFCLEQANLAAEDLEAVVFYEKPLKKLERMVVSQVLSFPRSLAAFRQGALSQLTQKLWVGSALSKALGVPIERILYSEHHLSHAASALYCSPFSEAAVLTVDGVGEWASTGLYRGGPRGIEALGTVAFPHSIGLVYSAFTAFLGFRVNNGEYKVMGMAAYGTPRFADAVRQILRLREDGTFSVDLSAVRYHWSATESFGPAFEEAFGPPRPPGSPFDPQTDQGRHYADIAASVQLVTEEALLGLARRLHEETGLADLCLAGGVALNSVANARLCREGPFERVFVHPAAGDAGGAVGAALWAWREVFGRPLADRPLAGPDLGAAWEDDDIGALLTDLRRSSQRLASEAALVASAADDLAAGRVVGWVQGRFEWGPRALGHRSILADPTRAEMKDRVNATVKFREAFRPFAPSCLADAADRYFEIPDAARLLVPWMLGVVAVRDEAQAFLPAVTHTDGTARLQTVSPEDSPRYAALLEAFGQRTGHPVLLNTSFNLKGEPIVSSPVHALSTFDRSALDVLYLGCHRVERTDA